MQGGFKVGAWSLLLNVIAAAVFAGFYFFAWAVLPPRSSYDLPLAFAATVTQPLYLLGISAWIKWMNA